MDPTLLTQLLVAAANASPYAVITVLFLFLFLDTRDANNKREEWFRRTIEAHDKTLDAHIDILREMARQQTGIAERQDRIERRLEDMHEDIVKDKALPSRRG